MKTQFNTLLAELSSTQMQQLTTTTQETVANLPAEVLNSKTNFSAADLWNIQRMKKSFRTSRRMFA